MAQQIRLGLVLEGEDARYLEERMRNPPTGDDVLDMFKEAVRMYGTHKF